MNPIIYLHPNKDIKIEKKIITTLVEHYPDILHPTKEEEKEEKNIRLDEATEDDIAFLINYYDDEDNYSTKYETIKNLIRNSFSSHFLCEGIDRHYIDDKMEHSDCIVIFNDNSDILYGFIILSFSSEYVKIELICSNKTIKVKGIGSNMIQFVEEIAETLDLEFVHLDSVTNSVGFYMKKGYTCDHEICPMVKKMKKKGGNKSKKQTKKTRKTKKTKPKKKG